MESIFWKWTRQPENGEEVILKQLEEKDPLSDEEKRPDGMDKDFLVLDVKTPEIHTMKCTAIASGFRGRIEVKRCRPSSYTQKVSFRIVFECGMKMALT